ncbi:MAG: M6 family metalloprotease domain-containing protein [Bacteroidetes bacterium]|nr:M6 family metalloprotease domain-containing protein [Bacteroidota bacterium]
MKPPFLLFVTLILLFLCSSVQVFAVPAYPYPFTYTQPNGKQVVIKLKGDEKVHWAETMDGYTLLSNGKDGWEYGKLDQKGNLVCSGILAREPQDRAGKDIEFLLKTPKKLSFSNDQVSLLISLWEAQHDQNVGERFEPSGTKHLVLILIGFTDLAFTYTHTDFNNLMNQVGYNLNGAVGSVKDFFTETSYNQFNLTTTVAGPYTAAHNMSYYGADNGSEKDTNCVELITEAVTLADPDVNYADFDNDGDGSVDGVYVVYAGYGQAMGAPSYTIWPHAGSIPTQTLDGKTITRYSCSNELLGTSGGNITTIGVICHEFGHVCGAPDYYDTDYATNGQYDGTGLWDVMANGVYDGSPSGSRPAHFNPYQKIKFNWVTPIVVTTDASLQLNDITTNKVIYKYNTTTANEYFLLENRQKTGFNTSVPGHGMMIFHVDENFIATAGNSIETGSHQGMFPMAANASTANGVMLSSVSTINTTGCPWPGTSGKTTFDDATTPNSKSWAPANTNAALTSITENSGVISLCFISCPAINPVFNFTATPASSSQVNLSWIKNAANDDVIVAWNSSNTFGDPLNGTTYNVTDVLSGGGTIIYKGPAADFNHTSLSPLTPYYYKAWSLTSTPNYSAGNTGNTTTLCSSVTSLPVNEGFEGAVIPSCWTQESIVGSAPWEIKTAGTNGYPASPHSGTYLVRCRTTSLDAGYITKLISEPIDLSGSTSPVLKFWHTQDSYSGFPRQDILRVYYRTSALGAWTQLAIYTSQISTWTLESISLPNPSSTYYIALEATVNAGTGVCVDDIYIRTEDCTYGNWLGTVSSDWFNSNNWCGSVPTATSDVVIPSGTPYSPAINASGAVCRNIIIDNSATLSMSAVTGYTLSVSGNWTNNGTFTAGAGTLNFNGTNDLQTISGTSTTTFYILQVSKGAQSRILEATSLIAFPASPTTNPLIISSGTFKLSSASTLTITPNQFNILTNGGLWNNGGTINTGSLYLVVYGLLRNSAGTTNVGYILDYYTGSTITMEGGALNIAYCISPFTAGSSTTTFIQSGGTITTPTVYASPIPFDFTSGSSFTMSGGTIVIQRYSTNSSDYRNLATTYNVTGGTLQIGNGSTGTSQTIRINSTPPIYNLVVNAYHSPTAQLVTNNLTVKNDVTISGGTLHANNLNLNVSGNWTNNGAFTAGTGTVIFQGIDNQNIAGTSSTTFYNLIIATDHKEVRANSVLNIGGNLTLNPKAWLTNASTMSVTGTTLLQATSAGNASFVENGTSTFTGTVTVERFIPANTVAYVSSPVSGATRNVFSGSVGNKLYQYNASSASWELITIDGTALEIMRGYVVKYAADKTLSFAGQMNTGTQASGTTSHVTLANGGYGWNLIGNPYSSAINVGSENNPVTGWTTGSNIQGFVSYRKSDGNVAYWNKAGAGTGNNDGTQYIPPAQAYWINLEAATNIDYQSTNSTRLHNTQAIYKSVSHDQLFRLTAYHNNHSDETTLGFFDQAMDTHEKYDAEKMFINDTSFAMVYTLSTDSVKLAINGLSPLNGYRSIPLGFEALVSGQYSFTRASSRSYVPTLDIHLRVTL